MLFFVYAISFSNYVKKLGAALARHTGQEEGEAVSHLWTKMGILLQRVNAAILGNRIPHHLGLISMGFYNSTFHCLLTMINVGKPWNTHTHTMLSLSTSEWKCLKDQQMCFSFVLTKCVTVFVCYTRTQQPRGQSCKRAGWEQVMKWYWSQFSFYISSFL